ncbi:cation:proton antiporter [Neiella marina]|uniref:Cation:proton antiporter n=1 Tax=Neiella marina TaxID=508461 RepID=A0A8J2U424_9GAMM|nr:monovalent cation/H+ antiporter subunit D family protein [Neiella marina]GGA73402.1 cation:proton antiporter [Neiella marina]
MNLTEHLAALQVVVPLLAAPVIVLLQGKRLAWAATTATSVMAFIIAVALTVGVMNGQDFQYFMGSWDAPYGIELRVDALSALVLLVVTGASTVALLAAYHSVESQVETERQPLFYAAWVLALAGLTGITVAADAFNIFVFMEISSLASYVLVAGGPDRRALPAVFKYLIFGTIGATFYLIGVGLIYMMTGTLNLADMELRIHEVSDQSPILVAAGFITVGLALKAAVFPLHIWLPSAYTFAPHAVTVFLAACATKVSLYVLLRFDFFVFQQNLFGHEAQFAYFLMPLALAAIIVASAIAMFEKNVKRLLAWSSVAQIGYIILGASLVTVAGLSASILHIFNHALAKGTLFLVVACLALQVSQLRLGSLAGIAKAMPWTCGAFVVAGLSLIGVPGTAGFVSKWYLISAVLSLGPSGIALAAVIVVSSLMAVVYIWRIVEQIYFQPATAMTTVKETPISLLALTWLAALANIYFGLNPELPVTLSSAAATVLMGHLQ